MKVKTLCKDSDPIVYLKFAKRKKYAKDIKKGKLFTNTVGYFRQLGTEGVQGQGDENEVLLSNTMSDIQLKKYNTKESVFNLSKANYTYKYDEDEKIPIVCFMGFTLSQIKILKRDETEVIFKFPFTEEEYEKMENEFGRYCVIIAAKTLNERIASYRCEQKIPVSFEGVKYCVPNCYDKAKSFFQPSVDRFLYKNEEFSYQREYRLVLDMTLPEDHYIDLGSFGENAEVIKSEKIKDKIFGYKF